MPRGAVNTLEQRQQLGLERLVVVRAAKPTAVAEIDEFGSTLVALLVRIPGQVARVGLLLLWRRLIQVLLGTLVAEVIFLDIVFGVDLGDLQGCQFRAVLALHRRTSRGLRLSAQR